MGVPPNEKHPWDMVVKLPSAPHWAAQQDGLVGNCLHGGQPPHTHRAPCDAESGSSLQERGPVSKGLLSPTLLSSVFAVPLGLPFSPSAWDQWDGRWYPPEHTPGHFPRPPESTFPSRPSCWQEVPRVLGRGGDAHSSGVPPNRPKWEKLRQKERA